MAGFCFENWSAWRSCIKNGKPGPKEWTKYFSTECPPDQVVAGTPLYAGWPDGKYWRLTEIDAVTFKQGQPARSGSNKPDAAQGKVFKGNNIHKKYLSLVFHVCIKNNMDFIWIPG